MLPGGLAVLWLAGSLTWQMIQAIHTSAEVVMVNRLHIAGLGAGLGLIGTALMIITGEFLQHARLTRWASALMVAGAALALVLPLPASLCAHYVLSSSGYETCAALSEPSFKLSRTAWVRDAETCRKAVDARRPRAVGSRNL